MQTNDVLSRVARGAHLLEEQYPGSMDRLCARVRSLNIAYDDSCTLGLLFGSYKTGHHSLFVGGDRSHMRSAEHGFMAFARVRDRRKNTDPAVMAEYQQLTAAWRALLMGYARIRELQVA
ncbi:MAG TPA: hypothetical protein VFL98_00970 [Candidatus Paceibacterota bacterium]|nr:hypothetical protein [Candidatus Paceibacterota bacterium]